MASEEKIKKAIELAEYSQKSGRIPYALNAYINAYHQTQQLDSSNEKISLLKQIKKGCEALKREDINQISLETIKTLTKNLDEEIEKYGNTKDTKLHKNNQNLEQTVAAAVFSISSFIIALFFLSSNFTGYAVANMSISTYNPLGVLFFITGLIFAVAYIKNKKKR